MADIFVSYASADRERAEAIARILTAQGYSVWWDRTIPPGQIFDDVIQKALEDAKCVVVLWSAASVVSNWVRTESAEAAGRSILVPALLEDVRIPIEFKRIQSANLVTWDSDPAHPEFQNLLASVARVVAAQRSGVAPAATVTSGGAREAVTAKSRGRHFVHYALALGAIVVIAVGSWLYLKNTSPEPNRTLATKQDQDPVKRVDEPAAPSRATSGAPPASVSTGKPTSPVDRRINLLAKENGGHVVAAPDTVWARSISDYDDLQAWAGIGEAVFAFKDEAPATFDTFLVLITRTSEVNLKEFELLVGNESPTGSFASIGRFATQNVRLMNSPFQEFKFAPVKAKYLKVKVLTDFRDRKGSAGLHKFQLMGSLD